MKIFLGMLAALFLLGCNGDNAYDGENGLLNSAGASAQSLEPLYTHLYQSDANASKVAIEALLLALDDLNQTQNETLLLEAQEKFHTFVLAHKRVEAAFVADEFERGFLDTLGYMEYFHTGKNSDMMSELDAVFASSSALESALYKNANKSITSLEYTLFGEDENMTTLLPKMTQRRAEASLIMAQRVATYTVQIQEFYANDATFTASLDTTVAAIINQLIDSTYKLKEWRVGEAAGFVLKYAGSQDRRLLEYYKSRFSLEAIQEILGTHKRIMQEGLLEIASSASAANQAEAIVQTIESALAICESYGSTDLQDALSDAKTQELYNTINVLQQNYTALINTLNFEQKIIEADGD